MHTQTFRGLLPLGGNRAVSQSAVWLWATAEASQRETYPEDAAPRRAVMGRAGNEFEP